MASVRTIEDPTIQRNRENDNLLRSFIATVDQFYVSGQPMTFEAFLKIYLTDYASVGKRSTKTTPGLNTKIVKNVIEKYVVKVRTTFSDQKAKDSYVNKEVKKLMEALQKMSVMEDMANRKSKRNEEDVNIEKELERARDVIMAIRNRFMEALKENPVVNEKYSIIKVNSKLYVIGVEDDRTINMVEAFKVVPVRRGKPKTTIKPTGKSSSSAKLATDIARSEPVARPTKSHVIRKSGLPSDTIVSASASSDLVIYDASANEKPAKIESEDESLVQDLDMESIARLPDIDAPATSTTHTISERARSMSSGRHHPYHRQRDKSPFLYSRNTFRGYDRDRPCRGRDSRGDVCDVRSRDFRDSRTGFDERYEYYF